MSDPLKTQEEGGDRFTFKKSGKQIPYTDLEPLIFIDPLKTQEERTCYGFLRHPLKTQEGGDHYSKMKIQPVAFCHANKLPFVEGNIVKYVCRHRTKNGLEDLKKAIHYLELLIKLEYEGE